MKKILTAAALAATLPQAASALPLVDFYAGAYYWDQGVTGEVGSGSDQADLEDDLNLDGGGQNVTYFAFEHPIPVIPNIKLKQTSMESDGSGTLSTSFDLAGTTVNANQPVATTLNLSHTDYTLYWGLPLPIVTLDFGLTARQFDGEMEVLDDSNNELAQSDLDFVIPMGYLKVGADIPLTGLSFAGEMNTLSIGDTSLTDFDVNMTYVLPLIPLLDVGITAGFRSFDADIDEDEIVTKATISGPYLGLSLHL